MGWEVREGHPGLTTTSSLCPASPLGSHPPAGWLTLVLTFSPLALLMALRGLSTRRTRRIFTTLMALDLAERSRPGSEHPGFGGAGEDVVRRCPGRLIPGRQDQVVTFGDFLILGPFSTPISHPLRTWNLPVTLGFPCR